MKNFRFLITILIVGLQCSGCKQNDASPQRVECVKGKFLSHYCEGVLIQVLESDFLKGEKLRNPWNNQEYDKAVLASVDLPAGRFRDSLLTTPDAVFYFRYQEGGLPRKQFIGCNFEATITLTYISTQPCSPDEK